jgi:phage terminase large subunit-like protein
VPFFFVPESKVEQRTGGDGVDYRTWGQQGHIIVTEGNVQDYNFIQAKYIELADKFNIVSCAFDRWNSSQLVINLLNEGAKMNPIGMGFVSQSQPTKMLEGLVLDKKINHAGQPVLAWNMSNVTLQEDPAGNVKINKGKSKDKIDGVAALIMALAEYMNTLEDGGESIYEDRGLLFL